MTHGRLHEVDLPARLEHFHRWFTDMDTFAPEGWQEIALEAKAEIERLRRTLAYIEAEFL